MADLRISELAALAGGDLAAGDLLAIADVSASETKKITVTDLVGNATTLIADATIPGAKILFGSGTIPGSAIATGGVDTAQLADDGVTGAKLADESTVDLVTTLPASGAFVGQIALDTDDDKIYCWDGSTWVSVKAAGSINNVVGSSSGIVNISISTSGDEVTISTTLDNTSAAAQFLAGPTGSAGAASYRTIVGTDLPTATTSAKGAVIVNGNGLTLSGSTIAINNSVTSSAIGHLVTYDANGLVTGGDIINPSDLPIATSSAVGAVKPGTGLEVDVDGFLNHTNSVAGTTGTKITYDGQGHVTGSASLEAADIPDIDASKITSGTFGTNFITSAAVTGVKLSNESTVLFGGSGSTAGVVTFPTAEFKGQYFYDELNQDLYIWSGSAWLPITIISGELVFAGTYDASVNQVASVTSAGAAVGLTAGSALPAASTTNNRYYLVVSDSGTGSGNAPAEALAPPDMILSNGTTWELIDVSNAIAGQTAANISFTPYGDIIATNVQTALQELDDEKASTASPVFTGNVTLDTGGTIVFEGSTANDYETTLTVVDPTADRTITFPNVTGTVVTTGDTGTVTSTMIADGTIVNADINASAAIAFSKLASLSSARILVGDASNVATSVAVTGDVTISNAGVTSIASGVIVNADINASAAIALSKLATDVAGTTATQTLTNKTLTDPALIGTILEDVYTITDGAAFEIDPSNGSVQLITLGANRTPKATNFADGEAITLMVDDGTAYTLTWTDSTFGGSGVVWKTDGGSAPTLNTTGYTAIVLWKVGGQVYGARVGDA